MALGSLLESLRCCAKGVEALQEPGFPPDVGDAHSISWRPSSQPRASHLQQPGTHRGSLLCTAWLDNFHYIQQNIQHFFFSLFFLQTQSCTGQHLLCAHEQKKSSGHRKSGQGMGFAHRQCSLHLLSISWRSAWEQREVGRAPTSTEQL